MLEPFDTVTYMSLRSLILRSRNSCEECGFYADPDGHCPSCGKPVIQRDEVTLYRKEER